MSVKAFSVTSNPDHPGARRLAASARYWGWDHTFVVKRSQPENGFEIWRPTYRAEQLGMVEFLRYGDFDYALYVDAWDSVFTGPPAELSLTRGRVGLGGDTVLYPDGPLRESFPPVGLQEFRYVNAGCMWGDRRILVELAEEYLEKCPERLVNQEFYNFRYLYEIRTGQNRLSIDTKAQVVLDIMLLEKRFFEMRGNRPHFLPTDTYPLIVHAPGMGVSAGDNAVKLPDELERLYAD